MRYKDEVEALILLVVLLLPCLWIMLLLFTPGTYVLNGKVSYVLVPSALVAGGWILLVIFALDYFGWWRPK